MEPFENFLALGVALVLGLLIGLERGWKEREAPEGSRIAGIRTYGLLGLLGGTWALVAEALGEVLLGFGLLAIAGVLVAAYWSSTGRGRDLGITGLVAGILAFVFGAMVVIGYMGLAAAATVVTVLLLGYKPQLHGWLERLEQKELFATFKLLLITVVILPILPDQGYGPWEALNPFRIWWMVILIAGISFAGYVAVRLAGPRLGLAFTGLVGGLASSTAVTLNFSRAARRAESPAMVDTLAGATLFSCATMFPRILVIVAVLDTQLFMEMAIPMGVTTLVAYFLALLVWRRTGGHEQQPAHPAAVGLYNPFDIKPAVVFGLVLAAIAFLSRALQVTLGEAGLYGLAATAGLADVAAISLSMADLSREAQVTRPVAALSLFIAAVVNTLVKIGLAGFIGGRRMGVLVAGVLILAMVAGLPLYWILPSL